MQVMNLFYQTTRISARPRIFGVVLLSTPTPYNFKTLRLERSLDATVHGVTEKIRQAMLDQADRPNEMVVLYDEPRPNQVIKTALYKRIEEGDPDRKYFARYFRAAETAAWSSWSRHARLRRTRAASTLHDGSPAECLGAGDEGRDVALRLCGISVARRGLHPHPLSYAIRDGRDKVGDPQCNCPLQPAEDDHRG